MDFQVVVLFIFFMFTPKLGEGFQFDSIFSDGLKPPTRFTPKKCRMGLDGTYIPEVKHGTSKPLGKEIPNLETIIFRFHVGRIGIMRKNFISHI